MVQATGFDACHAESLLLRKGRIYEYDPTLDTAYYIVLNRAALNGLYLTHL